MEQAVGTIVLDTDAAILLGNCSLAGELFDTLPVGMTSRCLREAKRKQQSEDLYVAESARDIRFRRRRGQIETINGPSTALDEETAVLARGIEEKYDIDAGEQTILRKLLADDPKYWVVAAQDGDARAGFLKAKEQAGLAVRYVGTPALAFYALTELTDVSQNRCESVLKTEVEKEGWNWDKLRSAYLPDLQGKR